MNFFWRTYWHSRHEMRFQHFHLRFRSHSYFKLLLKKISWIDRANFLITEEKHLFKEGYHQTVIIWRNSKEICSCKNFVKAFTNSIPQVIFCLTFQDSFCNLKKLSKKYFWQKAVKKELIWGRKDFLKNQKVILKGKW